MLSVTSPFLPCTSIAIDSKDDQPLMSFDDILDIAREFEFASTITYITEIEETNPISLEHLFATMFPTEKTEESPVPTSISRPPLDHDRDRIQDCEWPMSTPASPDSTESTSSEAPESCQSSPVLETRQDPAPLQKTDGDIRIEVENPVPARLLGWSPPDGSQFLELDDDLLRPKTLQDKPYPSWLAKILGPASNPEHPQAQTISSATRPAGDDGQARKPMAGLQATLTSWTRKEYDDPRAKTLPPAPPTEPVPPPSRALPPIKAELSRGTGDSQGSKNFAAPDGKPLKLRLHPLSVSTPVPRKHASAPRGGIPPHIARSVTKANTLRAEKERKMAKASSKGSAGEGKKASVLRIAGRERERETRKGVNGGGGEKKLFAWDDEEWDGGRVAKRTRV